MEPFGEWRADTRSALVASLIANTHRDPKVRPEPFSIDDFMLFRPPQPEHDEDDGATLDPNLMVWFFEKTGTRDVLEKALSENKDGR